MTDSCQHPPKLIEIEEARYAALVTAASLARNLLDELSLVIPSEADAHRMRETIRTLTKALKEK